MMPDLPYPLDEWAAVASVSKTIFSWPDWETPQVFVESKKAASQAGRSRFVSHEAERCRLRIQVMDCTGATIEGALISLLMWRYRPLEDATAILTTLFEGKAVCLSRIDMRPGAPHPNTYWRRFGCPPLIDCSHVHPFEQNATLGRRAFDPYANLPVAYPLDDEPGSLRDFLQVVEATFKVDGLTSLPPPPTQGSLI